MRERLPDRMPAEERASLVGLFRGLWPRSVRPARPGLREPLAALAGLGPPRVPRAILFDVYGTLVASCAGGEPLTGQDPLTPQGGDFPDAAGNPLTPEVDRAVELLETELGNAGYPGGARRFSAEVAAAIGQANAEERISRSFPEVDIRAILAGILPDTGLPRLRRIAVLLECWLNPCAPMPGARVLVHSLAVAGIPFGLVSNAQFYTPLLLEALFGSSFGPDGTATGLSVLSWQIGIAKPDPDFFRKTAALLAERSMVARDVLVVGNSAANDVAPAKTRGFMTALLARDARSFRPPEPDAPLAELPDIVLTELSRIERIAGIRRR